MTRTTVTRDGWILIAGATGLAAVAWVSANNLLYLVAAPVLALLVLAWPAGRANVAGVQVRRRLPAEFYAGRDAAGVLLVEAPARPWNRADLVVNDEGTGATATVAHLPGGQWTEVPARWRFSHRGPARLSAVSVRSTFPFGLLEHRRRLPLPAQVLVYPRPRPSLAERRPAYGTGGADASRPGGVGDVLELREYVPGDPQRRIHWPTSARHGTLLVAERAEERARVSVVEVQPAPFGPAWERELSRACGEIRRAFAGGHRVALTLPALGREQPRQLPPGRGGRWRRTLLDALASLPREE